MRKVALTFTSLGVAALIGLTACDNNERNDLTSENFTLSQIFISSNGAGNVGAVEQLDSRRLERQFRVLTNTNGKIQLNGAGDLFGTNSSGSNNLVAFTNLYERSRDFNTNSDSQMFVTGVNALSGLALVDNRSLIIVCDTTANTIIGVGQKARGTAAAPAAPVFTSAVFAASASPNDCAYDATNDRLYVALDNGTLAVFNTFLGGTPSGAVADALITMTFGGSAAVNLTSALLIGDSLFLTDAGTNAMGVTDGSIGVVNGVAAKTATTGTVNTDVAISGTNSGLVDPNGIAFVNNDFFVTDPGADRVFNFDSGLLGTGGNVFPARTINAIDPTSTVGRNGGFVFKTDANDVDTAVSNFNLVFTLNAGGTGKTLGMVNPGLTTLGVSFTIDADLGGPTNVENCFVDQSGNVFITADAASSTQGTGGLIALGAPFGNRISATATNNATTGPEYDSVLTGNTTQFRNPKGIDVCRDRGVIIICENDAALPQIIVYGINASGNNVEFGRTTNLGLTGRRPWDCDYDSTADRLFVACTDGTCIVYDNFLASKLGGTMGASPERTITPSSGLSAISVNLHGVVHVPGTDQLVLSDVGLTTTGSFMTDGQIFVINNASAASGMVIAATRINGATNTMLGNPVDIVNNGSSLYVAEKANNVILRFDNILNRGANQGDVMPDAMISVTAPESVSIGRGVPFVNVP
jgi:hypothetical protein